MKWFNNRRVLMPGIVAAWGTVLAAAAPAAWAQPVSLPAGERPYTDQSDGAMPCPQLVLSGDTLYGATSGGAGGFWGYGSIFKMRTDGTKFKVLHRFSPLGRDQKIPTNRDGAYPAAGLALSGDTLYGTAREGGDEGCGVIFKMNVDGTHFAVLRHFKNQPVGANADGCMPKGVLTVAGRTLFGTTERGGFNGGTVFKINTDGSGYATLHRFANLDQDDLSNRGGAFPSCGLLLSGKALYGVAHAGGTGSSGVLFKLDTDGGAFQALHNFARHGCDEFGHSVNDDGAWPEASLTLSGATLLGTAPQGGPGGGGTIFKIGVDGSSFQVLHAFSRLEKTNERTNHDGAEPGRLALSKGTIFGVAREGGTEGAGTLFKLKAEAANAGGAQSDNSDELGFAVVRNFAAGEAPNGELILSGDTFYTVHTLGEVFKLKTDGAGYEALHRFSAKPLPPELTD